MIKKYLTVCAAAVVFPAWVFAAPAVPAPGDDIKEKEPAEREKIETVAPEAKPAENSVRFTLSGITVEHPDMKLNDAEIQKLMTKYLNREIDGKELTKAVNTLTAYAREHGYPVATAYIPNQRATDQRLTLKIEAGKYGKIKLDNKSELNSSVAEGMLKGLKEGKVIKTYDIETSLYNLRDLNGVEIIGVISPGEKQGTSDLEVKVANRKKTSFTLYAENYGSKSSGRYRYGLQGNLYNPFGEGGKFTFGGMLSNQKQHNYNIGYEMPVGHSATKIGIGFSRSDYELGNVFRALGAKGNAKTWSVYAKTPLWNTRKNSLSVIYGYNYRDITDELTEYGVSWKKHSNAINIGLDGLLRDNGKMLSYNVSVTTGTFTPDTSEAREIARAGNTEGRFTKANFELLGIHSLGKRFDVMMKLSGQKAANNLDSSEHIYLGGARGVRAYPQGEASGDEGLLGTLEFRYHTPIKGLTLSAYYDAGHVHIGKAGGEGNMTLKGYGVGVTYAKRDDFFARFDYARRIGGDDLMSSDAESKQRMWFILGKIF